MESVNECCFLERDVCNIYLRSFFDIGISFLILFGMVLDWIYLDKL